MFGFRTPVKATEIDSQSSTTSELATKRNLVMDKVSPVAHSSRTSNVRKSIGEWESGKPDVNTMKARASPNKTKSVEPAKQKPIKALSQESKARNMPAETPLTPPTQAKPQYASRLAEARACVAKAKLNLGNSRNTKTEIKTAVTQAIERLYQLVKEAEAENAKAQRQEELTNRTEEREEKIVEPEQDKVPDPCPGVKQKESELLQKIEDHSKLLKENGDKIEKLTETLENYQASHGKLTYASVAAAPAGRQPREQTALHSVVVVGRAGDETGEEVLNRIREAINAKDGGIMIEKVRKAKDSKVIIGCKTEEERQKVKERLKKAEKHLEVVDVTNKNPLVILRDVMKYNSDEDILSALEVQNKDIFDATDAQKPKMEIVYKKKARNLHTQHVVMRVPPKIWQRMVEAGSVRIDLQRVRVADQSPLVQCSLCLGYGHGRRFCLETLEKCSHCGGPHMRTKCADFLAGATPSCCNCVQAKVEKADHNAFSQDCTIRRKWDALARATVAYC